MRHILLFLLLPLSALAALAKDRQVFGEYRRHQVCDQAGTVDDWLVPDKGKPVKIKMPKGHSLKPGTKAMFKLTDKNDVLAADGPYQSANETLALACINRTVLVVPVSTSDFTWPISVKDTFWQIVLGPDQSVRAAYLDMAGIVFSGTVLNPLTVTLSKAQTCSDYYDAATEVLAQLDALGVPWSTYNHIVYALPAASCGFSGMGELGGRQSWVWGTNAPVVFVHEVGHNLGFGHSRTDTNNDGVPEAEYGDYGCFMGGTSGGYRLANGSQRGMAGWNPWQYVHGYAEPVVTNVLTDINSGGQPSMLLPGSGPRLSFRRATTRDPVSAEYAGRVEVHNSTGRIGRIDEGWTLTLGGTPFKWAVEVIAVTTTSATVVVTTTECDPPCPTPPTWTPPPPVSGLIVNNEDANTAWIPNLAAWTLVRVNSAAWNNDLRYVNKEGYGADFLPALPTAGNYEVFVWYAASSNRATNVLARIWSPNQSATSVDIRFNQQINGSQWVSLGTYSFEAGQQKVGLRAVGVSGGSKYVIADAIKLEAR